MGDAIDLRKYLEAWPYDGENDSRVVRVSEKREVLQVRTPLGLEQYELDGRPDGVRPHEMESELEYQLKQLDEAKAAGKEDDFELSPRDCAELFNEGTLYYFRYIRLFQIKDWDRTIRDTTRNLRVFDLVNKYARREDDQLFLEKWRPYILRVNACAAAMQALEKKQHSDALSIVRTALEKVGALDDMDDETFTFEKERSITALRELSDQIEKERPLSELEKLEKQLSRAIDRQEFENAAKLRDRIKQLKSTEMA
jgi:hypothetical protein